MPDSPPLSRVVVFREWLGRRFSRGGVVLLGVMTLMLVGAITFAIEGEKPWGKTVQKRLDKKQALQPKEYAVIGLWWAAVVNAGVLAVLLGTAGKWMPGKEGSRSQGVNGQGVNGQGVNGQGVNGQGVNGQGVNGQGVNGQGVNGQGSTVKGRGEVQGATGARGFAGMSNWVWGFLLGAVFFGAWERWPKLTQSYWNDEEYAIKRYVHGSWERQKDGSVVFEETPWTDTLFENRNGNNHLLNSLVTRVSMKVWRTAVGHPREEFNEAASRTPHFIAGLASILVVFLLGRECGSPLVGLGAAWLLALHPWHIRYSVEMRGYALMLFFVGLALLGLAWALRTNRLRWWLMFAASEALFLLSFPGALYVALMMNLVAAAELLCRRDWGMTGRLVAFNALAAVPVLQWLLPSVPQILGFLKEEQPAYVTDVWGWMRDLGAAVVVGWPYENTWPELHVGTDWQHVAAQLPLPPMVVVGLLAVLVGAGLLIAVKRGTAGRLIVLSPVLAAVVSIAMNLKPGSPMTVWYLIYLLIPASIGVNLALEAAGGWKNLKWLPAALVAWFTVRYAMGTAGAVEALRDHDRQPIRQAVALAHEKGGEGVITATFGVSDRQSSTYDPAVWVLETAEDLEKCVQLSRTSGKPLYVYYCSDEHGRKRRPEIYTRVVKSGEFDKVATLPGSEELFSYRVYRLK